MNNELNVLKKSLDEFLSKKRQKELGSDRETLIKETAIEVSKVFRPILEALSTNSRISREELKGIANDIAAKINIPEINVPEIVMPKFPEISVPEPKVTVNFDASRVKVPNVIMPSKMGVEGEVSLKGINYDHPLPVQIWDGDGKPVNLLDGLAVRMGGSGGKIDYLTIKGFSQSAFSVPVNSDGEVKVAGTFTAGAVTSAYVIVGNTEMLPYNSDNPLPVTITSGATATTATNVVDSTGVAYTGSNPLPVAGAVSVSGVTGSIGATILNGEGLARDSWLVSDITNSIKAALVDSSGVQYSGTNPVPAGLSVGGNAVTTSNPVPIMPPLSGFLPVSIYGATTTLAATPVDPTGVAYGGSNPQTVNVAGVTGSIGATILNGEGLARDSWLVSAVTASIAANVVDSSGVAYSGTNPVPVSGNVNVNGTLNSILATGVTLHDSADDGDAPLKVGGVAVQANPTAVAGGDRVRFTADDLGRQITRPVQVRDLIKTAYVTEDEVGEVVLLAGASGEYHDLIYVLAANESTAAINLDFRQTTGGTVQMSLEVPANGTAGVSLAVPIPQDHADATWTVQNSAADNSTTVYSVTALFSKEV
jgi:hypothetical protein